MGFFGMVLKPGQKEAVEVPPGWCLQLCTAALEPAKAGGKPRSVEATLWMQVEGEIGDVRYLLGSLQGGGPCAQIAVGHCLTSVDGEVVVEAKGTGIVHLTGFFNREYDPDLDQGDLTDDSSDEDGEEEDDEEFSGESSDDTGALRAAMRSIVGGGRAGKGKLAKEEEDDEEEEEEEEEEVVEGNGSSKKGSEAKKGRAVATTRNGRSVRSAAAAAALACAAEGGAGDNSEDDSELDGEYVPEDNDDDDDGDGDEDGDDGDEEGMEQVDGKEEERGGKRSGKTAATPPPAKKARGDGKGAAAAAAAGKVTAATATAAVAAAEKDAEDAAGAELTKQERRRQRKRENKKKAAEAKRGLEQAFGPMDTDDGDLPVGVPLKNPRTKTLKGGLKIKDTTFGGGKIAVPGKNVKICYEGCFPDGRVFDKNQNRRRPLQFRVGMQSVIVGMDRGVEGMRVGGSREIAIPAALGYGARGTGPIPANQDLVFRVELIDVLGK